MNRTFGTLLIRRKANERPSEIELRLRPLSQKIRIVEKLAGGAHLMVPGSPSVAVRIYTMEDIRRLELSSENGSETDVDGLQHFRDSFEFSMVVFVLPGGEMTRDQLGRRESFVNLAQKALLSGGERGDKKRAMRTLIVPDITQAIHTIDSVVQSLSPQKREKRKQYFTQIGNQHYLPNKETKSDPTQESIASHVSKTFHAWAERFEMPEGDSNVLLNILGSLGGVVGADAKALDDLPIRNTTKDIVSMFFGAPPDRNENTGEKFDTGSIGSNSDTDAFDNIDDEDLLRMTEPDALRNAQQTSQWSNMNNVRGYHADSSQGRHFQSSFNQNSHAGAQGGGFLSNIDFTPLQPSHSATNQYQQASGGYSSIIPDSFGRHDNFRYSSHAGHSSMHADQYGNGRVPRFSPQMGSHGSNYQRDFGYDHSARYYTQQFM